MANDEQVAGHSFQIAVNGAKPVEVDLCEQHEKEFLSPLLELLDDSGQPVEQRATTSVSGRKQCSMCEKVLTREGLRKHLMTQHGIERRAAGDVVREIFGTPSNVKVGERPCPDCGQKFDTPQGLGVHRRTKHGYVRGDDD